MIPLLAKSNLVSLSLKWVLIRIQNCGHNEKQWSFKSFKILTSYYHRSLIYRPSSTSPRMWRVTPPTPCTRSPRSTRPAPSKPVTIYVPYWMYLTGRVYRHQPLVASFTIRNIAELERGQKDIRDCFRLHGHRTVPYLPTQLHLRSCSALYGTYRYLELAPVPILIRLAGKIQITQRSW